MHEFGDKPEKKLAKVLEQKINIRIPIMKSGKGEENSHPKKKLGLFQELFS